MIRAIDCSMLKWYKRSTLYIKSDRIDQCCESESYRISRQPTTDHADGCRQMSNMYGFIAAFAMMSDLFQTIRFAFVHQRFIGSYVLAMINQNRRLDSFGATQCNLMNVVETTRHHSVQSAVKNYINECTTRSPCYLRCDGYIWIPWNYFTSLLRSPRRVPRSGDKLNNKNKNVVVQ